jgi:catecholate siderophore receptor
LEVILAQTPARRSKKSRQGNRNLLSAAHPASRNALLPLGGIMLAASFGSQAQTAGQADKALAPVTVREKADAPQGKDSVRATNTGIGKGNQELRDIPQSITVVTEKLIDDRNLDTMKDVLKNTAGVTFLAAEGGEEDIRLRGFSLNQTGDIYLDGMRDPAFYDRDTFANDRIEVIRGSAGMLFGRGSTGGAVNQVSKVPRLVTEHEVTTTIGNFNYKRIVGDFNINTGENAGLRINAMATNADNNGAGSSIDKKGLALAYRWGIGTANEFSASLYWLDNNNGMNYGLPWIQPAGGNSSQSTILPGLNPEAYYGMASDYNAGGAKTITLSHLHRFSADTELRTQVRKGQFERDQRAGTVRFAGGGVQPAVNLSNFGPNTIFNRGTQLKVQDFDTTHVQSDLSSKFNALGMRHEVLTGVDFANEEKTVYTQVGANPAKPTTRAGTPFDGASINEGARSFRVGNDFEAKAYGIYAQDLVQIAPSWKVLGGLRYDNMKGRYATYTAAGVATPLDQKISEWSKRFGVLYQPNPLHTYHFSYGTSFNTSGDTYSYNATSVNTAPEESQNIEFGARLDSADRRFTTRLAIFRTTKTNERNTDPDTAGTRALLSGKRHASGVEIDVTGRLTNQWEIFGSYMWLPDAKVDAAAPCPPVGGCTQSSAGNRPGDRPGLTPRHSGTVWNTYQLTPQWRIGAGINFRGRQAPADGGTPSFEAPSFVTADLMAEYAINQQFTLKGNITNVTDKYYADSLYRGHYIPGAGRLVQVSLAAKF